tara:strand:- start:665 stop:1249 length:585 start_codon:yes stop_codon:yes gene_type:complete
MKLKIGLIDYGFGNWASISKFLRDLDCKTIISNDLETLEQTNIILLPGVGAFKPAMQSIKLRNIDSFLKDMAKINKPIIGICLGMQLLGQSSEENGEEDGIGLIPAKVIKLFKGNCHIGWNDVLSENINIKNQYYFNHSYGYKVSSEFSVGTSNFENVLFTSILKYKNIVGCQFHPEKSQVNGTKLFKYILKDL